MSASQIIVYVHSISYQAKGIVSLDLRPVKEELLPTFTPGAHIDICLPGGLTRSYSLISPPDERHCYVVCVMLDRNSRGGSKYIHELLRVGTELAISAPRNNFELSPTASRSVLIAGGIGITPIYSMYMSLSAAERPVEMLYCARSRTEAALLPALMATGGKISTHFDDEKQGAASLKAYLSTFSPDTHFYCCGPAAMLSTFEADCKALGLPNWHLERFAADNPQIAQTQAYDVVLRKSGGSVRVEPGHSLLDSLLSAGIHCDYACKEGICGACETTVLEGVPDHRDSVLTEAEREENSRMMVCVSGCKGNALVLDL